MKAIVIDVPVLGISTLCNLTQRNAWDTAVSFEECNVHRCSIMFATQCISCRTVQMNCTASVCVRDCADCEIEWFNDDWTASRADMNIGVWTSYSELKGCVRLCLFWGRNLLTAVSAVSKFLPNPSHRCSLVQSMCSLTKQDMIPVPSSTSSTVQGRSGSFQYRKPTGGFFLLGFIYGKATQSQA